jgi:hypothetical protein
LGAASIAPVPCSDPEGRPLTLSIVEAPRSGALGPPDPAGRRAYAGAPLEGTDMFKFRANNGVRDSNIALATIRNPFGPPNRAPIAKPDKWVVKPGFNVDESVLANDYDPEGDKITARVIKISFASKEWSKMDADGGFLYVAGPGTKRTLHKTITYVAVDSQGNASAPTKAVVTIARPKAKKSPVRKKHGGGRAAAVYAPTWFGPNPAWQQLCFGAGLKAHCFTMLSVQNTQALNAFTGWTNRTGAARACLKFGFLPMKNAACAQQLLERGAGQIWDKSVINNAAKWGYCLMFHVDRDRTLAHPLAGRWGKPQYSPDNSLTRRSGLAGSTSGYGHWLFGLSKWRVPLFCDARGQVWAQAYQPLVRE